MSEALLPCPFCGGEAVSIDGYREVFFVQCDDCGATFPMFDTLSEAISAWNRRSKLEITGDTSDGYHTFNELYNHRAVLFSVICNDRPTLAWKSKQHHDGTMYDGMFIVGIQTPDGQATYHYDVGPYWNTFRVPEFPRAPEWDGHTPAQAIERIGKLCAQPDHIGDTTEMVGQPNNKPLTLDELRQMDGETVFVGESVFWFSGSGTVSVEDGGVFDPDDQDGYWPFDDYGKWLAYRTKPERSEG